MNASVSKVLAVSAVALLLGACAGNELDALAKAPLSGNEYRDQLSANYAEFAKYEYEEMYDQTSASHFAKKGMDSLKGATIQPEQPEKWGIANKEMMSDLQGARTQLINSLNSGAAEKLPTDAARAMVSYDCWVEQSAEAWQYKDIAGCRENFKSAMSRIDQGMKQPVAAVMPAPPAPAAPPTLALLPAQYVLFFDWNSAVVNDGARAIIRTAADTARGAGIGAFDLVGHADRSGATDYNQRLSVRRANAVAKILVDMGYNSREIRVTGRGELDPLAPTADGVREPQNRRVQIEIKDRRPGV
jgi:outer membrane protein OmpA-like peptidoglycan-associated protein